MGGSLILTSLSKECDTLSAFIIFFTMVVKVPWLLFEHAAPLFFHIVLRLTYAESDEDFFVMGSVVLPQRCVHIFV